MATLPTKYRFSGMTLTDEQPVFESTSLSLKRLTRRVGAQRWGVEMTTIDLFTTDRRELRAFLTPLGSYSEFDVILPVESDSLGTLSGLVTVSAAASIGDNTIPFNGTGDFAPGDLLRFDNHQKVYQAIESSGGIVTIFPPLINGVGVGDVITYEDVPMTVYNTNPDIVNELTGNGGYSPVTLNLVEAI